MLSGSWKVVVTKEVIPEANQRIGYIIIAGLHPFSKGCFKGIILPVMHPHEKNEIEQVIETKCAVAKTFKPCQVCLLVMHYEIIRSIIHQVHQLIAFGYYSCAFAPGKNCGEETSYLPVLL